ncbi:hypothetical protein [Aliarcobacter butzleri]|uniref:hypothetical protein n=1 Tax=Aliarcobacter butzleri TaxID=28197 RepID=UPI0021B1F379|nr:hypothetical protein [Aliarcobacter butzleri]MCT7620496.1 hypothetical protein [Aliarcobacter butzleri]
MISQNQKVKLFDEFYNWLVADGLKAKKSERLHRKKIFASLLADSKMTLDNFTDFLEDKKNQFKIFENQIITFDGVSEFEIQKVEVELETESFRLFFTNNTASRFNFKQFSKIKNLIKIKE